MALEWKISHPNRMVEATAHGHLKLQDIERCFDDVMISGALPYRKLFDATQASSFVADGDMMMLGARMSAYAELGPLGPLAIVAPSDLCAQVRLFAALAPADRPQKIFNSVASARKWLGALNGAAPA
ncbi:MAG: hypothetical protein ACT4O6_14815 [Reyranella sp.]